MRKIESRRYVAMATPVAAALSLTLALGPAPAHAQTCDTGFATSCQGAVTWISDVFMTADGYDATTLSFATYISGVNGCIGYSFDPAIYAYTCWTPGPGDVIADYANYLDWLWTQNIRAGAWDPTAGRIMDLGGPTNRVVVFPIIDHMAPNEDPCEAFEYTVWLSDDFTDPTGWQVAELYKAFGEGWDANWISDGYATVWRLPCGQTFRYVSVQAGNNGNPTAACYFDSSDDEIDAIAGLNEDETGICVDLDFDGFGDVLCGGADCDDTDPNVHPGVFETCEDGADVNCDGLVTACPIGTNCVSGQCLYPCLEGFCPPGLACEGGLGGYCATPGCFGVDCGPVNICMSGTCVDPCDSAVCPPGETCVNGGCVDPCAGVSCPMNQICDGGPPCQPGCGCVGCSNPGDACDMATGHCVEPTCVGVACAPGETCAAGACVDTCTLTVCPLGQMCTAGACLPDPCFGILCIGDDVCVAGACVDPCDGISCGPMEVCQGGTCMPDPCALCTPAQTCIGGTCVDLGSDASTTDAATDAGGGSDSGKWVAGDDSGAAGAGCGCRCAVYGNAADGASGTGLGVGSAFLLGLAPLIALALRRRQRGVR